MEAGVGVHRHTGLFCAALTSATGSDRERLLSSYLLDVQNSRLCVSSTARIYCCFWEAGLAFVSRKAVKRSLIMKSFKCRKHLLCTQEAEKRRLWVQGQPGLHRELQDTRTTEQRDPVSKSKTEKTTCGMALLKAIYVLSQKRKKFVSKKRRFSRWDWRDGSVTRLCAALTEDPHLIPSTKTLQLQLQGDPKSLASESNCIHVHIHTHIDTTCTHTYTSIYFQNKPSRI